MTLKSQALTDFIFKCDLNFRKINVNSYWKPELVKMHKMIKSQNVDFWLEKVKVGLWLRLNWSNDHGLKLVGFVG